MPPLDIDQAKAAEALQQASLEAIAATAAEILAQVRSMPAACLHWKPAPDVWTVTDNLCHIAEFVPYWTKQIEQIIHQPQTRWGRTHHDPQRLAAVENTSAQDIDTITRAIESAVQESLRTLQRLTAGDLQSEAPSNNPRWGTKSADFVLQTLLVQHLKSHLAQIARNLAQLQQARNGTHPQES